MELNLAGSTAKDLLLASIRLTFLAVRAFSDWDDIGGVVFLLFVGRSFHDRGRSEEDDGRNAKESLLGESLRDDRLEDAVRELRRNTDKSGMIRQYPFGEIYLPLNLALVSRRLIYAFHISAVNRSSALHSAGPSLHDTPLPDYRR